MHERHPRKSHLTKRRDDVERWAGGAASIPCVRDREWYCRACGARITEGPDGTEYGHSRHDRCDHRPDGLDTPSIRSWRRCYDSNSNTDDDNQ